MPDTYTSPDLDLSEKSDNGPARPEYPFLNRYGDASHVVFTIPYIVSALDYAPTALNTAATINGVSVFACGETAPADAGAGVLSYEGKFANVPASHFDYETYSATYPGYWGERVSYTQTVQAQLQYEYFKTGTGETYETPAEIPLVAETRVTNSGGLDVSILSGGELFLTDGGEVAPGVTLAATSPTLTAYKALVTGATYSIAVDCKVEHYLGNIWARITRRVLAK